MVRSESFDEDPLDEDAALLEVRRADAAVRDAPLRALLAPDDRLEPEAARLEPDDRVEPDDRLEPDAFARVDLPELALLVPLPELALLVPLPELALLVRLPELALLVPLPELALVVRLARVAPVEAALVEPPLLRRAVAFVEPPLPALLALLPVVFRPVCFRELFVVATSPPFPGLMNRYPLVWVRNRPNITCTGLWRAKMPTAAPAAGAVSARGCRQRGGA